MELVNRKQNKYSRSSGWSGLIVRSEKEEVTRRSSAEEAGGA